LHQARFSGIAGRQVTGRTHGDHPLSPWHIAYAEGTVEEQVGKVMVERIAAAEIQEPARRALPGTDRALARAG
jgi:hypothetical protein